MKRRPPKIVGCSPEDLALRDEKVVKGTVKKKRDTHGTQVSVSRLTYKPGDSACGAPDWLGESQYLKKNVKKHHQVGHGHPGQSHTIAPRPGDG